MEIKDHVCSLEPGKELKELGVKQNSLWYWTRCVSASSTKYGMGAMELMLGHGNSPSDQIENYSAFTDAELEREIFKIIGNRYDFAISFSPDGGVWGDETFDKMYEVDIIDWFDREESLMERADTGANAKAKMLIRLLKNNLIEK